MAKKVDWITVGKIVISVTSILVGGNSLMKK